MQILNEVYFGRNSNLEECQKDIEVIKDSLMNNIKQNVNKLPEMADFKKRLALEFGFEEVRFYINPDYTYLNAVTMHFLTNKKVEMTQESLKMVYNKSGIRYKNPKGKIVFIETGARIITDLTPEGIMSVILHEIGHNFYISDINFRFYQLNKVIDEHIKFCKMFKQNCKKLKIKDLLIVTNNCLKIKKAFKQVKKIIYQEDLETINRINPNKIDNFMDYIDYMEAYINVNYDYIAKASKEYLDKYNSTDHSGGSVFKAIWNIFRLLALPFRLFSFYCMPFTLDGDIVDPYYGTTLNKGRNDEKFADNFAASYGYGAGLANSIRILSNLTCDYLTENRFLLKFTLFAKWKEFLNDEHPSDLSRMKFLRDKVKYELANNKNLTPAEKKQLQQELERIIYDLVDNANELDKYFESFEEKFKTEEKLDNQKGAIKNTDIYDFTDKIQTQYKQQDLDHRKPTSREI